MGIFDHKTESPLVIDHNDGSFTIGASDAPRAEAPRTESQPSGGKVASIISAILIVVTTVPPAHAQFRGAPMMRPMPTMQAPIFRGPMPAPMAPMLRPMPGSTPMTVPPGYRPFPMVPITRAGRYIAGQGLIQEGFPTVGRLIRGGPLTGVAGALLWPNVAR